MPRFFIDGEPCGQLYIGGEDGRHIVRSLRMREGEELTLCNGEGMDFFCTLLRSEGEGAWVLVNRAEKSKSEPRTQVTVCQCLPKGDKLEQVVQKAVELGAAAIWPIESSRCVAKLQEKKEEKKILRLQKIAREAAQQSGRGIIPKILSPSSFEQALREAAAQGEILFFYEQGMGSLRETLRICGDRLFVFVGPEGGFSAEEAQMAVAVGGYGLTLGPRILRTETAPLAALSAIFYEKGDMER